MILAPRSCPSSPTFPTTRRRLGSLIGPLLRGSEKTRSPGPSRVSTPHLAILATDQEKLGRPSKDAHLAILAEDRLHGAADLAHRRAIAHGLQDERHQIVAAAR